MPVKKRQLEQELRHELTKEECYTIMDYLMVQFSDKKDFHYNYYFDTKKGDLSKKNITLRLRTIVKNADIKYLLTLKIPTIDEETFLEYNEKLEERSFRHLAYENKLPEGEITELTSIHGGDITLTNMIKVNRVIGLYQNEKIFFDRISHKGITHYEIGVRIDATKNVETKAKQFKDLLKKFGITFKQAERRSVKLS